MQVENIESLEITGPRLLVKVLTDDLSMTKSGILTGEINTSPVKRCEVLKSNNEEYPVGSILLFIGVGTRVTVGAEELMIIHEDILEAVCN